MIDNEFGKPFGISIEKIKGIGGASRLCYFYPFIITVLE